MNFSLRYIDIFSPTKKKEKEDEEELKLSIFLKPNMTKLK